MVSKAVDDQSKQPSMWVSPFSRVFLGVPVAALVLAYSLADHPLNIAQIYLSAHQDFWFWIVLAAVCQLVATIQQTILVARRNFALGIMYLKIMLPAQAVLGVMLFADSLSVMQWFAVSMATVGVVVMAIGKSTGAGRKLQWDWRSLSLGSCAGVILAFTGLFIREASEALNVLSLTAFSRGVASLFALASIQLVLCSLAIAWRDTGEFREIYRRTPVVAFTGLTSVAGSICWFVAFSLAPPALVNTVGQSEFFFAMLLSLYFFKERPTRTECLGMMVMLAAIVVLLTGA